MSSSSAFVDPLEVVLNRAQRAIARSKSLTVEYGLQHDLTPVSLAPEQPQSTPHVLTQPAVEITGSATQHYALPHATRVPADTSRLSVPLASQQPWRMPALPAVTLSEPLDRQPARFGLAASTPIDRSISDSTSCNTAASDFGRRDSLLSGGDCSHGTRLSRQSSGRSVSSDCFVDALSTGSAGGDNDVPRLAAAHALREGAPNGDRLEEGQPVQALQAHPTDFFSAFSRRLELRFGRSTAHHASNTVAPVHTEAAAAAAGTSGRQWSYGADAASGTSLSLANNSVSVTGASLQSTSGGGDVVGRAEERWAAFQHARASLRAAHPAFGSSDEQAASTSSSVSAQQPIHHRSSGSGAAVAAGSPSAGEESGALGTAATLRASGRWAELTNARARMYHHEASQRDVAAAAAAAAAAQPDPPLSFVRATGGDERSQEDEAAIGGDERCPFQSPRRPLLLVAHRLAVLQQQQHHTLHQLLILRLEQLRLRQQQLIALKELLRSEVIAVEGTPLQVSAVEQAVGLLSQSLADMRVAAAAITQSMGLEHVARVAERVSRADGRAEEVSRMARQLLAVLREFPRRDNEDDAVQLLQLSAAATFSRGATEEELSQLETSVCAAGSPMLSDCCSICLADYQVGDLLASPGCPHRHHAVCLREWLRVRMSCPLCKHVLVVPEDGAEARGRVLGDTRSVEASPVQSSPDFDVELEQARLRLTEAVEAGQVTGHADLVIDVLSRRTEERPGIEAGLALRRLQAASAAAARVGVGSTAAVAVPTSSSAAVDVREAQASSGDGNALVVVSASSSPSVADTVDVVAARAELALARIHLLGAAEAPVAAGGGGGRRRVMGRTASTGVATLDAAATRAWGMEMAAEVMVAGAMLALAVVQAGEAWPEDEDMPLADA